MTEDLMRYDLMAQEALRGVVRLALERAASDDGLPGEHHFFVTFDTTAEGVELPDRLRTEYPEEMTIVFKPIHFSDLIVGPEAFEVTMTFNGKAERMRVPYAAVATFFDPSVRFGLQFPRPERPTTEDAAEPMQPEEAAPDRDPAQDENGPPEEEEKADVVSLDAFRKK